MTKAEEVVSRLREYFPNTILNINEFRGETTLTIPRESLRDTALYLRDDPSAQYPTATLLHSIGTRELVLMFIFTSSIEHRALAALCNYRAGTQRSSLTPYIPRKFLRREVYDLLGSLCDHPFAPNSFARSYVWAIRCAKTPSGYEEVEFTHLCRFNRSHLCTAPKAARIDWQRKGVARGNSSRLGRSQNTVGE
jgi:hypothetical protein